MLFALLFSVALQSPQIGDFFTLPGGIPTTNISSHDTPGSDPNDFSGWYLGDKDKIIVTNTVFAGASIELDVTEYDTNGTFLCTHTYEDETGIGEGYISTPLIIGQWGILYEVIKTADTKGYFSVDNGEYGGEIELGYLPYIFDYTNRIDVVYYEGVEIVNFKWTVTPTSERIETTNLVSRYRVPRMTPEIQAGINSTFEGYLERLYYSSQGQSNVWDNAIWGQKNHHSFDFGVPGGGRYYVPTNRIVNRRFTEYSNTVWFAETAILENYEYGTADYVKRPGWISDGTSFEPKLWWSSTVAEMDGTLIPQFSGIPDPTETNGWDSCNPTYYMLASENPWKKSYTPNPYYAPTATLLREVSFGKPGYAERATDCGWQNTNGLTMVDLVATNFPRANVSDITFDTRRLYSNRLCAMNQYLGLSDRTYHIPKIEYPLTATGTTYRSALNTKGCVTMDLYWNASTGKYERNEVPSEIPIVWDEPVETNEVSKFGPAQNGCVHYRMSGTSTKFEITSKPSSGAGVALPPPSIEDFREILESWSENKWSGSFGVSIVGGYGGVYGGRIGHLFQIWYRYDETVFEPAGSTNVTFLVEMPATLGDSVIPLYSSMSREYSYSHTTGPVIAGMTQPGSEGWSRTYTNAIEAIAGWHYLGYSRSLSDMAWVTTGDPELRSTSEYSSEIKWYTSRSAFETVMTKFASETYSRFLLKRGIEDPHDWRNIIPLDEDLEKRMRESLVIRSAGGTVATIKTENDRNESRIFEVYGTAAYGNISVERMSVYRGNTFWEEWTDPVYPALLCIGYDVESEYEEPETDEDDPLSVDARIGVLTRTDWKWNAVRRVE